MPQVWQVRSLPGVLPSHATTSRGRAGVSPQGSLRSNQKVEKGSQSHRLRLHRVGRRRCGQHYFGHRAGGKLKRVGGRSVSSARRGLTDTSKVFNTSTDQAQRSNIPNLIPHAPSSVPSTSSDSSWLRTPPLEERPPQTRQESRPSLKPQGAPQRVPPSRKQVRFAEPEKEPIEIVDLRRAISTVDRQRLFELVVAIEKKSEEQEDLQQVSDLTALLDDGSSINVMPLQVYKSMAGSLGPLTPSKVMARLADGMVRKSEGTVQTSVTVGKCSPVPAEVEVLDTTGDNFKLLLGRPWKTAARCIHFYELDTVYFPTEAGGWHRVSSSQVELAGVPLPATPLRAVSAINAMDEGRFEMAQDLIGLEQGAPVDGTVIQSVQLLLDDVRRETDPIEELLTPFVRDASAETVAGGKPQEDYLPSLQEASELENLRNVLPIKPQDKGHDAARATRREKFGPRFVRPAGQSSLADKRTALQNVLSESCAPTLTWAQRTHFLEMAMANPEAWALGLQDCRYQKAVLCDPQLEPGTKPLRLAKRTALSPPQKAWLHDRVRTLIKHGLILQIPESQVEWVSDVKIVPKDRKFDSNINIEHLRAQAHNALVNAGLEKGPRIDVPERPVQEKRENQWRLVHNYAPLNTTMRNASFPPGDIDVKTAKLARKRLESRMDGLAGFMTLLQMPKGVIYSCFEVEDMGYFGYRFMPFGYKIGPSSYQRFATEVFGDMLDLDWDFWMDDIGGGHHSYEAHFRWLQKIIERAADSGFTLSIGKCQFFADEVTFCGQNISHEGVQVDPGRVAAILDWPTPTTVHDVIQFKATCPYMRNKIPGFAAIAAPLDVLTRGVKVPRADTKLLQQANGKWISVPRFGAVRQAMQSTGLNWTKTKEEAFLKLKAALTNAHVLRGPRYDGTPFVVECDWSSEAMGAALLQKDIAQPRTYPIAYASKRCTDAEAKYSPHVGELAAAKWALGKFAKFTFGQPVELVTDCKALRDVLSSSNMPAAHARWREDILMHDIVRVTQRVGTSHTLAHGLSHRPADADPSKAPDKALGASIKAAHHAIGRSSGSALLNLITSNGNMLHLLERFESDKLGPTVRFLVLAKVPSSSDLPEQTTLRWRARSLYVDFEEGKVWHQERRGPSTEAITQQEGRAELARLHSEEGHFSRDLLIAAARKKYFWPTVREDAEKVVRHCEPCQLQGPRHQNTLSQPISYVEPMQFWAADFLSLPQSGKFKKVLVIADYGSRFIWTFLCAHKRGQDVLHALSHLRDRWTLPAVIITDNGSHFDNADVGDWLQEHHVQHRLSPSYAPWVNGLVERDNGLIVQMLRKLSTERLLDKWPNLIGEVTSDLNHRLVPAIGYSPAQILFGLTPRSSPLEASDDPGDPDEDNSTLHLALLDSIRWDASTALANQQLKQKSRHNLRVRQLELKAGDLVLKHESWLRSQWSNKLHPRWSGPYKVKESFRNSAVIEDLDSGQQVGGRVHLKRLKRFFPSDVEPRSTQRHSSA
ncbi:FOG: Transposon-encoded proteins with TYA, reverse transcriptase, integrase domains in various combinations [Ceraceosorus bombacis]|uniref:FOG: Transposon-encoded proteins with TYA, reverse transcriptase, integrase domains in various combinations n=1 Tax=Ceraceosorus bombacis TaxID=401625 RepID=A0A0P1BHZ8_9BASI|nr:FOG: Transposon-encoded proteins with TYA, reverse transcriptase, integrase domains in various combinations [Ceraceosorus bombacis]